MIIAGRQADLTVEMIIAAAPDAAAAIIACGTGARQDAAAEAAADALPVEAQTDIIEAVAGLTFSKGLGPFVRRLTDMAVLFERAVEGGNAPANNSPPQSNS
jgi:hypothetical protein